MFDHPSAAELIAAARAHIEQHVLPALTDSRLRFQTLVAVNVLAIVERELAQGEPALAAAWARLNNLLGQESAAPPAGAELQAAVRARSQALCDAIRAGEFDAEPQRARLLAHLRATAAAELAAANPRYLARAQPG